MPPPGDFARTMRGLLCNSCAILPSSAVELEQQFLSNVRQLIELVPYSPTRRAQFFGSIARARNSTIGATFEGLI